MKNWILCVPLSLVLCTACNDRDSYASTPKLDTNRPTTTTGTTTGTSQNQQDDTALTQRVELALRDDTTLSAPASRVTVTSSRGVVTLNGQVDTQEQRQQIESKVRATSGVTSVVNRLEVKGN